MAIYELSNIDVKENEPLSRHSTFKIGGCAKIACFPKNCDELCACINYCKTNKIRFIVMGNASNVLFDDLGFDGAVIFTVHMSELEYINYPDYTLIKVSAGRSLTELASETGKKHSLSGLEFAYGIPGTVGGAVYMNAGAYGGQMSDVVVETQYLDLTDMTMHAVSAAEHRYSYRKSVFMQHPEYVIVSTTLKLTPADPERIFAAMAKNITSRKDKQPLEFPNAGSVFKRPAEHVFAGKLIQDANLKGYSIGGAEISQKHAGFIVNRGNATSKDVLDLIEYTKNVVAEQFGYELECEIIHVPYN